MKRELAAQKRTPRPFVVRAAEQRRTKAHRTLRRSRTQQRNVKGQKKLNGVRNLPTPHAATPPPFSPPLLRVRLPHKVLLRKVSLVSRFWDISVSNIYKTPNNAATKAVCLCTPRKSPTETGNAVGRVVVNFGNGAVLRANNGG